LNTSTGIANEIARDALKAEASGCFGAILIIELTVAVSIEGKICTTN
jgi:hypothetical protein